jgi:nucleoside-diphosphate-sugar epimerase
LQFLVNELKNNKPINLYNNGNFFRDYMHVLDVCEAIKLIIDKAPLNEIYNVGTGKPVLFKALIDHVVKETNSQSTITSIEPPEFHKTVQASDIYLDVTKLTKLGFKPKHDLYKEVL